MDMVVKLTDSVGLVHQLPFVCDREGFVGVLEKVKINPEFMITKRNLSLGYDRCTLLREKLLVFRACK